MVEESEMNNERKALVMLSGGLDSSVAFYWALRARHYSIIALTFNYSGRSKKEIEAARLISKSLRIRQIELDLGFLRDIEDAGKQNKNPFLKSAPSAYIPSRTLIFYGIASSLAEMFFCPIIVAGHNRDDTRSFPDSSAAFFHRFNKITALGLISGDRTGRVILPLGRLSKTGVVKLGAKLGVPFEKTWSCYYYLRHPCGKCPACLLRRKAFHEANLVDPLDRIQK